MIVSDNDIAVRLASPINLINKLANKTSRTGAMQLFGVGSNGNKSVATFNPFAKKFSATQPLAATGDSTVINPSAEGSEESPTLDNLLDNSEQQIRLAQAHDKALSVLTTSLQTLSLKIDDIKPDKLPAVITATAKTIEGIRKERRESLKSTAGGGVHFHIHVPEQNKIEQYPVIDV